MGYNRNPAKKSSCGYEALNRSIAMVGLYRTDPSAFVESRLAYGCPSV
jgi:hypothetical protein